jgi:hypothetical protein
MDIVMVQDVQTKTDARGYALPRQLARESLFLKGNILQTASRHVSCDPSHVWTLILYGDTYGHPVMAHDLLASPGSDGAPGSIAYRSERWFR